MTTQPNPYQSPQDASEMRRLDLREKRRKRQIRGYFLATGVALLTLAVLGAIKLAFAMLMG